MTSMQWWRCKHGAPFDPKWRVVAIQAKSQPGTVWAVVTALYDRASQSADRGDVAGAGMDDIAEGLGFPIEEVQRIYSALKSKAVIIDNRIASWEKHQPKRERTTPDSSADRVRRHREKKKAEAAALLGVTNVTPKPPSVTPNVTPPVTVRNGPVTPVTDVTVLEPLQPTGEAQLAAINGEVCNATVTPRNAQRREDSFLLSSSPKNQNLGELQLVCSESKPRTKPALKVISSKVEKRGERWTQDREVPAEWIARVPDLLEANGLPMINATLEATKFKNYWTARTGAGATKCNWPLTFDNWVIKAAEDTQKRFSNGRSSRQFGLSRNGSDHPLGAFAQLGDELAEVPLANGRDDHGRAAH